jgi:hypothetical protein
MEITKISTETIAKTTKMLRVRAADPEMLSTRSETKNQMAMASARQARGLASQETTILGLKASTL